MVTQHPTFLMCPPAFFDVRYTINPWMNAGLGQVNRALALSQWENLHLTLIDCQARLEHVCPDAAYPDLVFTANAAVVLPKKKVLIAHFRHPQRQGESPLYAKALMQLGYDCVFYPEDLFLEGAGDALLDAQGTLWVGSGPRSDEKAGQWVQKNVYSRVQPLALSTEDFYHLDTCFCPLDNGYALAYLPAFDKPSQARLKAYFGQKLIELRTREAEQFNANAVQFGQHILVNEPSAWLTGQLEELGLVVHNCPTSEFIKSGGSVKCLTLRLDG